MSNLSRIIRDEVQQLAKQTGLTHRPATFFRGASLGGVYKRRAIKMDGYSSKPRRLRIAISVNNATSASLGISNSGFLVGLRRSLGKAIATGDAEFDQRFFLEGNPPELGKYIGSWDTLRRELLGCRALTIQLRGQALCWLGYEADLVSHDYMLQVLNLLAGLADRIEEHAARLKKEM